MATHIKYNTSIETVADMVDSIAAALESDLATESLAETWRGLTAKADALAENRRKLNRATFRAGSRLRVSDKLWDTTTAAFGRAVVDASGGRRDQAPDRTSPDRTSPPMWIKAGFRNAERPTLRMKFYEWIITVGVLIIYIRCARISGDRILGNRILGGRNDADYTNPGT